jgi:UDP-N-acetylglucosamine 2-epimerase (non-hydrolysing)
LRENTERPVTMESGTNTLLGEKPEAIAAQVQLILAGQYKKGGAPELWDGQAGQRIKDVILELPL